MAMILKMPKHIPHVSRREMIEEFEIETWIILDPLPEEKE